METPEAWREQQERSSERFDDGGGGGVGVRGRNSEGEEGLQRMRNKASTDNIHQRMSASTDKASTANASTDKAING
ncbi:hypothetical protein AgCh_033306 [Apium graveolens]